MNKKLARHIKIHAARDLRRQQTEAERILWGEIRAGKIDGAIFRRQHIIKGFIVDFYCPSKKVAIELDGAIHLKQKEADKERQKLLECIGIRVLRFKNEEVLVNKRKALNRIRDFVVSN